MLKLKEKSLQNKCYRMLMLHPTRGSAGSVGVSELTNQIASRSWKECLLRNLIMANIQDGMIKLEDLSLLNTCYRMLMMYPTRGY